MTEHEATRTLVKSPPELWSECSDPGSLGRHLAESFGEIRITRLEPETAVAWEGERVSGTVRIEPSAWGTRVTLTAQMEPREADAVGEVAGVAAEEPAGVAPEELAGVVADAPGSVEEPAVAEAPAVAEEPAPPVAPAGAAPAAPAATKRGFMARMRLLFKPASPADAPLEQSGIEAPREPEPAPKPEPELRPEPQPEPAITKPAALCEPAPEPAPDLEADAEAEAVPEPEPAIDPEAALAAALDSLGQAHHRPFSRA